MIINVGARTDIVHRFTPWLLNRLREGFVITRNPLFPNRVTRYELTPDKVDAILFCSKNYEPILPYMAEIARDYRIYCYYTITAYGEDIEPNVPDIDTSIETLGELSSIVGKGKVAWRYDPVLLTRKYTVERHLETFADMAARLAGSVDRCIFSFVEVYKKLRTNMPELVMLREKDMLALAEGMGKIARAHGMEIQTCGTDIDYSAYGIRQSGCATLDIIGRANSCAFRKLKHRGLRKGCHCIESRDIGAYDTCPNGCRYCYANRSAAEVEKNCAEHDPLSTLILGQLTDKDTIVQGNQESFLKEVGQLSFL